MLPFLRFVRLPNVFTAVADIALGFALTGLAGERQPPWGVLFALIGASTFLYLSGMAFNDVFDVDIDRRERPQRPIPSGDVPLPTALALAIGLMIAGLLFAVLAGALYPQWFQPWWRSAAVATALAGAILLYDGGLKQTPVGPLGMGLCRFLNVLLGASPLAIRGESAILGYPAGTLLVAAGVGTYIVGVTIVARKEAEISRAFALLLGLAVMAAGIVVVGLLPLVEPQWLHSSPKLLWLLLALLAVTVLRRGFAAVQNPTSQRVQTAVKQGILSLIMFDAAICLFLAPTWYAIAVVALLAPALLLGKWLYST